MLDAVEKGQLLGFRERVRGKHDLHAAALRDGNLVLAHERLRDLRSALNEVDDEIASLHKKYPDIGLTMREEQNQFWQRGVKVEIAYQKKEESFFKGVLRHLSK